jgi:hypothetical protein
MAAAAGTERKKHERDGRKTSDALTLAAVAGKNDSFDFSLLLSCFYNF